MPDKVMTKQEIQKLVELGLEANGCNKENSSAVARTIAAAELDGCAAHGLFRMPGYVASLRSGKVNGNASPVVSRLSPGVVKVDGDHGYAPLALEKGREALIQATQEKYLLIVRL